MISCRKSQEVPLTVFLSIRPIMCARCIPTDVGLTPVGRRFTDKVRDGPWLFDQSSYLGSKLTWRAAMSARQLSRECGTQARLHSRGKSC